jgi:hypothetical protein
MRLTLFWEITDLRYRGHLRQRLWLTWPRHIANPLDTVLNSPNRSTKKGYRDRRGPAFVTNPGSDGSHYYVYILLPNCPER